MSDTTGKVIKCRAAILRELNKPLTIEEIDIEPPGPNEVRIKIISNGVCKSDLAVIFGTLAWPLPIILGHEATGQVESVGPGVTYVQRGDFVIPSICPQCNDCRNCRSTRKVRCLKQLDTIFLGRMTDGTTRVTCKGEKINIFMALGSFAEYSVVHTTALTKLPYYAPLDKVCLIGCGVGTGLGAAMSDAKVEAGSICAVWGLGCIGLATVMGCVRMKASRIIAIDTNPAKKSIAMKLGATEFINPLELKKPITEVLMEITEGGLDYGFECVGLKQTNMDAFNSLNPANGVLMVVGVASDETRLPIDPKEIFLGKTIKGTFVGGWKLRTQVPKLVDDVVEGRIDIDPFISRYAKLEDINDVVDDLKKSKIIRGILKIGQPDIK